MKYILLLFIVIFFSCNNEKNRHQTDSRSKDFQVISVDDDYDNEIQTDSLFETIDVISLETNDKSLLSDISKVIIDNSGNIFVQNFNKSLVVFNSKGKFLRQIGRQGRGPGEYIQLAGFDIDNENHIHILDYHKILKYDFDGSFIDHKELKLSSKKFQCWPEQFVITKNGYYIWSGSLGIKSNNDNKYFAMYKLSNENEIIDGYFPVKYKIMNSFNRFHRYGNIYNIDPVFGNDTIYSIAQEKVVARYFIDFGNKRIKNKIPEEYNSFSDFKTKIASNSSFSPFNFTETKDWVYFTFSHDAKYFNCFYSKASKKTFISKVSNNFPRWVDASWEDSIVILVDPSDIMDVLENKSSCKWFRKLIIENGELKEKLNNISLTDNPVVFLCKMKKYSK